MFLFYQDVFRFEISVDYFQLVQVAEGKADLREEKAGLFFVKMRALKTRIALADRQPALLLFTSDV